MNLSFLDFKKNKLSDYDISHFTVCNYTGFVYCDYPYSIIQNKGGAIFDERYQNTNFPIYIQNCLFLENKATIGGAIFNTYLKISNLFNVTFKSNKAVLYGNEAYNVPTKIKLVKNPITNINETFESGFFIYPDFRPGNSISFLFFKFFNDDDQPIEIFEEEMQMRISILGLHDDHLNYGIAGNLITTTNQTKNLGGLIFHDLNFTGSKNKIYNISVKSEIIKESTYSFIFSIGFRDCYIGEKYVPTQNQCEECTNEYYSLTKDSEICQLCKDYMKICDKNNTIIQQGFWREHRMTDLVQECIETKDFCLSEDDPRFKDNTTIFYNISIQCNEGHIGALCGSCDIYAKIWRERYAKTSKTKCGKCSDNSSSNILILIVLLIVNVVLIGLSVKGKIDVVEKNLESSFVKKLTISSTNFKEKSNKTDIYLKMIITYSQIAAAVGSFNLQMPWEFNETIQSVSNPTAAMLYSLDCMIVDSFPSPPYPKYLYIKAFCTFFMPFIYIFIFFFLYKLVALVKLVKMRLIIFYPAFFFVLVSMQPNVVAIFIDMLSCTTVNGKKYIKADLGFECNTDEHFSYSLIILAPALIIWGFIIPIFIIYKLWIESKKLSLKKNLIKYGFLYKEYKFEAFYWEFSKMFQKLIITMVLSFLESQIKIKGLLILLSILVYLVLLHWVKPYQSEEFNTLDIYSCLIEYLTIFFGFCAYVNDDLSLEYIFLIAMIFINICFLIFIVQKLALSLLSDHMKKIEKILPKLKKFLPCCFFWVKINPVIKSKAQWSRTRSVVFRYLAEKKKKDEMEFSSKWAKKTVLTTSGKMESLVRRDSEIAPLESETNKLKD